MSLRVRCYRQGLPALWVTFSKRDDRDHLLWTDDYLAAFARAANAAFVTLERAIRSRYPSVQVLVLS